MSPYRAAAVVEPDPIRVPPEPEFEVPAVALAVELGDPPREFDWRLVVAGVLSGSIGLGLGFVVFSMTG